MSHAEEYLVLGLRLGKHVDGLVDAYYGPAELKEQVDAEEAMGASEVAAHAQTRDDWLRDQVHGCWTYARVLAGEEISYSDEVEGCYGVRPERTPETVFEAVHAELDELLPGDGSLYERRQDWRNRHLCPGDKSVELVHDLLPLMRKRTEELIALPTGEELVVEPVTDEPWWAFNYYLGDLRSRVVLNTDVPTTGLDVVHLVAHEVYPGHHTEHAVKEQLLIREQGHIEEGIQLVPTPQAVLSEGIAETGADVILDDAAKEEAYTIIRRHGLELVDPERSERISTAGEVLRAVGVNAALMIHEDGVSEADAQAYIEKWNLSTPEQASHSVSFVTDPTWRAYTITYSAGRDLVRRYVNGDPARFRTLLTEAVRIGDL